MAELPFEDVASVERMSLVEIAEHLQKVTSWIEAERASEREAREAYEAVASRAEARIESIRAFATALLEAQSRRMSTFEEMIEPKSMAPAVRKPRNVSEAIVAIWSDGFEEPLTTDEIATALLDRGYRTSAAPRSFKSSINQALAKLCRSGEVRKYRLDGSPIDASDSVSRARRYMASGTGEGG